MIGNEEVFVEDILHIAGIAVTNSDRRALGVVEVDEKVLHAILGPALAQNGSTRKGIFMRFANDKLTCTNTLVVVGLRREI